MDLRREKSHIIRKGFDWYTDNLGEAVEWLEFDASNTFHDKVYDEGGKNYKPGITMPVPWVIFTDDTYQADMDGHRDIPSLRFAVPLDTLRTSGLSFVMDSRRHKNDIIRYRGFFFTINDYRIQGRLGQQSMIVGVNCIALNPADDIQEGGPLTMVDARPDGPQNDDLVNQRFPAYEAPAYNTVPDYPIYEETWWPVDDGTDQTKELESSAFTGHTGEDIDPTHYGATIVCDQASITLPSFGDLGIVYQSGGFGGIMILTLSASTISVLKYYQSYYTWFNYYWTFYWIDTDGVNHSLIGGKLVFG